MHQGPWRQWIFQLENVFQVPLHNHSLGIHFVTIINSHDSEIVSTVGGVQYIGGISCIHQKNTTRTLWEIMIHLGRGDIREDIRDCSAYWGGGGGGSSLTKNFYLIY